MFPIIILVSVLGLLFLESRKTPSEKNIDEYRKRRNNMIDKGHTLPNHVQTMLDEDGNIVVVEYYE